VKVIIAGSRTITDYQWLCDAIDRWTDGSLEFGLNKITEVVSGKEPNGVDALGERWAREHDIPVKGFPADWDKFGLSAGPIRNYAMAQYADAAIILRRGKWLKSNGSDDMHSKMDALHKPVYREIAEA
jgi:hypothetical protein